MNRLLGASWDIVGFEYISCITLTQSDIVKQAGQRLRDIDRVGP